ncbi:MAG: DUF2057 family protein [Vibrio sp.]
MKMIKLLPVALLASVSLNTNAAELTSKLGIHILTVNGKTVALSDKVQLEEGTQQIVVRYNNFLRMGSNVRSYHSEPFVFNLDVKKDSNYQIYLPTMNNYNQVQSYFENDKPWYVVENKGKPVAISGEYITPEGFLGDINAEKMVAKYNQQKGFVFESGKMEELTTITTKGAAKTAAVSELGQLKLWYLKATKEDQKAFQKWIIDQN